MQTEINSSLANIDCLEYIKGIPDNSVDLILTDPPYNIAQYSTGNIPLPGRSAVNNDLGEWDLKEINPFDFVEEFKRIVKPDGNIFIFTSYNLIGKWHEAFDPEFDTFQYFIWHKTNPMPKIFKNGFLNSCEMIVCLWNKKHKWNFSTQNEMHNYFECPICMGKERLKEPKHPSQKPLKLLRHLIEIASNEGDVVFDPFMGVGSTGVAAMELGRRFIGCEIDAIFFEAAKKRINENKFMEEKSMPNNGKIGERDLDFIVLYILNNHPGIDTTTLKQYIWEYTEPGGVNLAPLVDRNDTAIDQIVRNIISHRGDSSNNIICRGLVSYNGGVLNITPSGKEELKEYIKEKAI